NGQLVGQDKFDGDGIRVPVQVLRDGKLLVYGNSGDMAVLQLEQDN
ncbi:MAG: protein assembly complex, lipoprotein component, partial [Marinobacter sp. T13-3]